MKKTIWIPIIVATILTIGMGAVLAAGYFKPQETIEEPYFVRQDAVQTIDGEHGKLTYAKSITQASGEVVDFYQDKDGNEYTYNASGEVVGAQPVKDTAETVKENTETEKDSVATVKDNSEATKDGTETGKDKTQATNNNTNPNPAKDSGNTEKESTAEKDPPVQVAPLSEEQLKTRAIKIATETFGKEYVSLFNETSINYMINKDRYLVTLSYVYSGITIERCEVILEPNGTLYSIDARDKDRRKKLDLQKLASVDMEAYVLERLGGKDKAPRHEIEAIYLGKNAEGKECLIAAVTRWEYHEVFREVREKFCEYYYVIE